MTETPASWKDLDLVALDIEGSGPQDPAGEAILDIAVVPIHHGKPAIDTAFSTLVRPDHKISYGPWISPGITNELLGTAPTPAAIANDITRMLDGKTIVGHNIGVDWRLLHKQFPGAVPTGLIDTLRLARTLHPQLKKGHSLTAWIDRLNLADTVSAAAPASQPHRALWDTVAAALLLNALMSKATPNNHTAKYLQSTAGIALIDAPTPAEQPGLWDVLPQPQQS